MLIVQLEDRLVFSTFSQPVWTQVESLENLRMILRAASPADVIAISRLIDYYARRSVLLPRSAVDIFQTMSDWVVVEQDGQIQACGSLCQYSEWQAEIRSLAVDSDVKGQGLGSAVVQTLIALAEARGILMLFALTHVPLFFYRLGFAEGANSDLSKKIEQDCRHCPSRQTCSQSAVVIHVNAGHTAEINPSYGTLEASSAIQVCQGTFLSHQFPYMTMGDFRLAKTLRRSFLGSAAKPSGSGAISTWRIK